MIMNDTTSLFTPILSNIIYLLSLPLLTVLIIAAAGNGGSSAKSYPASYNSVVSIGAIDSNKNKAGFSQYNNQVELSAPGVGVKSTIPPQNYATWSGTSMVSTSFFYDISFFCSL